MIIFLSFLSGFVIELLAVLWVHCSERDKFFSLFLIGLMQGASQVFGLYESFNELICALAFVLGYGMGPIFGILLKRRFL